MSFGTDNDICLGLGIATCKKIGNIAVDFGATMDFSTSFTTSTDSSNSVSIGFTYTYTTSSSPFIPSKLGDMFLTPSLNVKFSKSAQISLNRTTCAAAYREIISWSLDSPSNMPVCS